MTAIDYNTVRGAKLISWQNDMVRRFLRLRPDERMVIKKSRQIGCSFTFAQILFYVGINRPSSTSIYVTTTSSAARKFFTDMSQYCRNSSLVNLNISLLEMTFWNGSIIYFRSSESQLRGLSCKNGGILVVDEAAFLKDDVWTSILPFTTVSKANILIASTPWSKRGMFYTFYERALSGERGYHLIDTSNYDLSYFISDEQKDEYRRILTSQAYQTEIEGEFLDSMSGVFGDFQKTYGYPDDNEVLYCGIDFSTSVGGDYTVISGFNSKCQMCLLEYTNSIDDPVKRAEWLSEIINRFPSIKKVVCETNSIGSVYISLLKKKLIKPSIIEEFTTTNATKKEIIENLVALIGKGEITLLDDPLLDYQFSIFSLKELKNGNYSYEADPKVQSSHDDLVMATAFACKNFGINSSGTYLLRGTTPKYKLNNLIYEEEYKYKR